MVTHIFVILDAEDEPVGFSVYANGNTEYGYEEIVMFTGVINNFGNHFDVQSASFNCPAHGVYMFGLNIKNYYTDNACLDIMRDNEQLVEAWADYITSETYHYGQGSALIVAECSPGQLVWVKATCNSYVHGSARRSHFTGYLLHRY